MDPSFDSMYVYKYIQPIHALMHLKVQINKKNIAKMGFWKK